MQRLLVVIHNTHSSRFWPEGFVWSPSSLSEYVFHCFVMYFICCNFYLVHDVLVLYSFDNCIFKLLIFSLGITKDIDLLLCYLKQKSNSSPAWFTHDAWLLPQWNFCSSFHLDQYIQGWWSSWVLEVDGQTESFWIITCERDPSSLSRNLVRDWEWSVQLTWSGKWYSVFLPLGMYIYAYIIFNNSFYISLYMLLLW